MTTPTTDDHGPTEAASAGPVRQSGTCDHRRTRDSAAWIWHSTSTAAGWCSVVIAELHAEFGFSHTLPAGQQASVP